MFLNKKIIVLLGVCFSLIACAPKNPHDYNPSNLPTEQKGIVVINSSAIYKNRRWGNIVTPLELHWKSLNSAEAFTSKNDIKTWDASKKIYKAYQITPGQYYLTKYQYDTGINFPHIISVDISHDNQIKFDIKPGEVLYLGDIIIKENQEGKDIVINDSFEEAKIYVQNNHPELTPKLKNSLIQNSYFKINK